LIFLYQK